MEKAAPGFHIHLNSDAIFIFVSLFARQKLN